VERRHFRIPKRLSQRQKGLLEANAGTAERATTVHKLKCRLCPGAGLSDWGDFKVQHCDLVEAHTLPLTISFSANFGNFFARPDSLARHCKS
jgi:hypothetical protein